MSSNIDEMSNGHGIKTREIDFAQRKMKKFQNVVSP